MLKKSLFCLFLVHLIKSDEAFKTPVIFDKDCNKKCFENCDSNEFVFGKTFFSIRPQDSNTARRITRFIPNKLYYRDFYNLDATKFVNLCIEYQRSFDYFSPRLGQWFLFKGKNCLTIGQSDKNHLFDINSTQLGLLIPNNQQASFCLFPKIENVIFDIGIGFDLKRLLCNLWTKFNFVIAHCKTSIGLRTCGQGINGCFRKGLFTNDCLETPVPYTSICKALLGNKGPGVFPELNFGKFSSNSLEKTELAGIHWDLGYDIVRRERGHLGFSLHTVFPTGNRPEGKFVFEPIVGANKCWQLGLGINSSYDIYCNCNNKIGFYLDLILTHLFKSKQTRLFNLKCNGPLSQYLLLKKFDATGNAIGVERVANILAGETKIGSDVMFDGSIMFQVNRCNFFTNLGYNLWARSKEEICPTINFRNFADKTFGIKGNLPLSECVSMKCPPCPLQGSTGFTTTQSVENIDIDKLNVTQEAASCSPVNCGDNFCKAVNTTASRSTISKSAKADEETVFLKISDINTNAPLHPSCWSNKIFGSLGYNYEGCKYPFYVLIGGEIEFSRGNKAINQWGILAKWGITF